MPVAELLELHMLRSRKPTIMMLQAARELFFFMARPPSEKYLAFLAFPGNNENTSQ
jgi:hypothetical protein